MVGVIKKLQRSEGVSTGDPTELEFNAVEVVAARYTNTAGTTISGNTRIDFATKDFDSHDAVTTGASWKFTATDDGYYQVNAKLTMDGGSDWVNGDDIHLKLVKDSVLVSWLDTWESVDAATTNQAVAIAGSDIVYMDEGDEIWITCHEYAGTNPSLLTTAGMNYVSIHRIGGVTA